MPARTDPASSRTADADASASPPLGEDDAGRPIGHDEIDPELIKLIKPRIRLGLITSAALVGVSLFFMITLRRDLVYSRAGDTPREVTVAEIAAGKVANGSHITVHAVPDRTMVGLVARTAADYGKRIAPAQGADGALWILIDGPVWTAERSYQEQYSGRLRRIDELPFADTLRRYLRDAGPALRPITGETLRAALLGGDGAATTVLLDPGGDHLVVGPATIVELERELSDAVLVHAARTDRQPDEAAWRAALTTAGLTPVSAVPEHPRDQENGAHASRAAGWVFRVEGPAARAAAASARIEGALYGARVEPVIVHHRVPWQTLRQVATADGVALPADATAGTAAAQLSWAAIELAAVELPRTLPDGAMILLTRESPGTYWYILPVYVLLAAFAALFSWAFVRRLRESPPSVTPA